MRWLINLLIYSSCAKITWESLPKHRVLAAEVIKTQAHRTNVDRGSWRAEMDERGGQRYSGREPNPEWVMRKTCETGQGFPSKSRHLNKKFSKQIQDVRVPQKTQQHTQGRTTLTMHDVHRDTGISAKLETTVREAKLDEAGDVVRVSFLLQKSFRYVLETTGNPKGLEKKKGQDQTGV